MKKLKNMKDLVGSLPLTNLTPLVSPAIALRSVTSKTGRGVYASSDSLFKGAIFGRDSLEVAEDLMYHKPKLVKNILLTLASLQGEVATDSNEEEPGKIIHEYRTTIVDGKLIDDASKHIFEELSAKWGGNDETVAYYGSVDATPHFIKVLHTYCSVYGDEILRQKITLRSGHVLPMSIISENALKWLELHINNSKSGLVEYQMRNPHGLINQVWKDSNEFYVHENREIANHLAPISSIEVQGLAYDALIMASDYFVTRSEQLKQLAFKLRDRTIELLWDPNRHYFGLGTDFDKEGHLRIIKTITANPAALLDSKFFDQIPSEHREEYISCIVKIILGRDFLTDAGIRSRALRESELIGFWDYHGSFVTWPKETYDIAKGLHRQGFPLLARELENRILNVIMKSGNYPEFVYVDEWSRVLASAPTAHGHGELVLVDSTNKPETVQAWTVSAVMAIVANRLIAKMKRKTHTKRQQWQAELENKLLLHMPRVNRLLNKWSLSARYPSYPYRINNRDTKNRIVSKGPTKA